MYSFNETFDESIGKPVATAYRDALPSFVRTGVRNFFSNIDDLFIGVNNLLQGKIIDATTDAARLTFNSIFGLFGLVDIASSIGWEKHNEDFGQTFGRWGAPDGPYLVWPFLGSSTLRDSVGGLLDVKFDPVRNHRPVDVRNAMYLTRAVGRRADLLDASRVLEEAALDKYVFQRDAHLQRRRSLIHDGNPPRDDRSSDGTRAPRVELAPDPAPAPVIVQTPPRAEAAPGPSVGPAIENAPQRVGVTYEPRPRQDYDAILAAAKAANDAEDAERSSPAR
ncbi:MAG: VacJ family lipoprotein [Betaproteobacteria bacterium]|nr:VacJ family lipoprotein [Betaproteobacteria bacterium]